MRPVLAAVPLFFMIAALLWAILLQGKLRRQALIEKERARVLEAINSSQKLDDVLLMILHLIVSNIPMCSAGAIWPAACGWAPHRSAPARIRSIAASCQPTAGRLGSLVLSAIEMDYRQAGVVLETAAGLAALAIDNRRLYEMLMHRSQYDRLTNVANRFLLETRFDEALTIAGRPEATVPSST